MKIFRRLIVSTLAACGAMLLVVLVIAIADLYRVGHGHQPINRELLVLPGAGVSLGLADIILVAVGLATWIAIFRLRAWR